MGVIPNLNWCRDQPIAAKGLLYLDGDDWVAHGTARAWLSGQCDYELNVDYNPTVCDYSESLTCAATCAATGVWEHRISDVCCVVCCEVCCDLCMGAPYL